MDPNISEALIISVIYLIISGIITIVRPEWLSGWQAAAYVVLVWWIPHQVERVMKRELIGTPKSIFVDVLKFFVGILVAIFIIVVIGYILALILAGHGL